MTRCLPGETIPRGAPTGVSNLTMGQSWGGKGVVYVMVVVPLLCSPKEWIVNFQKDFAYMVP
jgi:hypothetical protein